MSNRVIRSTILTFPFPFFVIVIVTALFPMLSMAEDKSVTAVSAYEEVKRITDDLLKKLVEVQPLYETDRQKFYQEVDQSLGQFIDFDGFSRGVMAKYYRRATDEQKKRFVDTFRDELIQTYSKALVGFDNEEVIVKQDDKPQKDPRKAKIRLEIHGKDGTIYPVDYSLVQKNGTWKLRNIVINGINIGLQFRSQFSSSMQKYKNDIDLVIQNWNVNV